ncbi:MAG: FIST C-terminal domain-containing protein [Elusimicrobia bacterium]|nr:FIST C-terminal domain-containing protein [Elusimicrobiota bacterium]
MDIGIGVSMDSDSAQAAAEAVAQAKKTVPKPDLAVAFGSIHLDHQKLHGALCQELDGSMLMGGSCYAQMTNAGVSKEGLAVLLLSLDGARVRFSMQDMGADLRETGRALARGLPAAPPSPSPSRPLALAFAGITTGREHEMLLGVNDVIGPAPIFGGLCCGDYDLGMSHPDFWTNYQYAGARLTKKTARLALLDLPQEGFRTAFGFAHGWQPVGPAVELSSCEDGKVYEVGGVPVFDYYRQFLGRDQSDAFFELMVQRYGFSVLVEGDRRSRIKLPVACDFKEGCISYFPVEDLQGRKAQLTLASRNGLLGGARESAEGCLRALGGQRPDLVFVVSCCSRSAILHSRTQRELEVIQSVFGRDVPVFGYYSGGEFGPCLNRYEDIVDPAQPLSGSQYHTTTVCIMALKGPQPARASIPSPAALSRGSGDEAAGLRRLLAQSEEIHDDSEKFLANLSRKSYLDGESLRQQNEVIHRYTPHQVWAKVGASVAAGQYELPDSEFNGCFLFMDVKGFTSYSEEHGPSEVVAALNGIFKPATETIYSCGGDVDKFIGDCIFAVFPTPQEALTAGRRLLELFSGLKAKGSPFTVRIGINSGRAVRANVGSPDRREYTFIGDAVNTAQRLESNCTPGKLLVCEELYKLGTAKFSAVERREIKAKGKKNAVVAYELSL